MSLGCTDCTNITVLSIRALRISFITDDDQTSNST